MTPRRRLAAAALLPLVALIAPRAWAAGPGHAQLKAGAFDPPRAAPPVVLQGADGREFRLDAHRGRVVLMAFGFTSCPAVCPTTLARLAEVRAALGADAARLQVVFVTVDPERDQPARLQRYVSAFDPSFIGATGSEDALARVRRSLGVMATRVQDGAAYGFDHSSAVYMIDPQGRLRGLMPYDRPARDYLHDLRILLAAS